MLQLRDILGYYKRKDIRKAMVDNALDREIAVRYSDKGFGKRPDVLKYPNDILHLAKEGSTSFHASEELWLNPLLLSPNMKRSDVLKLRKGWDLLIDIDAPDWNLSRITAWLIVNALKHFGISAISVKFSGNKGFHIGVPFESFPERYKNLETRNLFPDAPRNIASFLLDHISNNYISPIGADEFVFGKGLKRQFRISYPKLQAITGKGMDELTHLVCSDCGKKIEKKESISKTEFHCPRCSSSIVSEAQFELCPKCNIIMEKIETGKSLCSCGSNELFRKLDYLSIVEVDTILISSRHLFRMPYSLHEKSGLASIPFNPEKILEFEKKFANPKIARISKHIFLDRKKAVKDEAKVLLGKAMESAEEKEKKDLSEDNRPFESLAEAVPEVLFPPCIKKMLHGMEDGRKRAVFILINFLKCAGWDYDLIEKRIREWNGKNPEPLREAIITGQLSYHKRNKDKILPPNCANKMYYKDMQLCIPDNFCSKIKNPVNYAILKAKIGKKNAKDR